MLGLALTPIAAIIRRALGGGAPNQVERLRVQGTQLVSTETGLPFVARGACMGSWADDTVFDPAVIAAAGANCVRVILRFRGDYSEVSIDGESLSYADDCIDPAHLAEFLARIQAIVDTGMWAAVVVESDCGQGSQKNVGYCSLAKYGGQVPKLDQFGQPVLDGNGDVVMEPRTFFNDLEFRNRFKTAWKRVARELRFVPRVAWFEVLPEPWDLAEAWQVPQINAFYGDMIDSIMTSASNVPFVVGPRSYEKNVIEQAYMAGRTNVIYTANLLNGNAKQDDVHARVQVFTDFSLAHNVPVYINQVSTDTLDDLDTNRMCGILSILNSRKIGWSWWVWKQHNDHAEESGILYEDGGGGYTTKALQLATLAYHCTQDVETLRAAAHAAITAIGNSTSFYYPLPNLSNVFLDDAGTVQATPANIGQAIKYIGAAVGVGYVNQTDSSKCALLMRLPSGEWGLDFGTSGNCYYNKNNTFFSPGDNQVVIASGQCANGGSTRVLFHCGNTNSQFRYPLVGVSASDLPLASWRGADNTAHNATGTINSEVRPMVLTALKNGNNKDCRANGYAEGATETNATDDTITGGLTRTRWGSTADSGSGGWTGPAFGLVVGKTIPTAEQLTAIERFHCWAVGGAYRGAISTLGIAATPVTSATVGRPYTGFTVVGSGGTGTLTYSKTGPWPAGFDINPTTGAVTGGTPAVAGAYAGLKVLVTDSIGQVAQLGFFIVIAPAVGISGSPITTATINRPYAGFTPTRTGGTGPYTYAKVGTWPTGLNLNTSTGVVSGTPTQSGTFAGMAISVTDLYGSTATLATFSLNVAAAIQISGTPVTTADVDEAYTGFDCNFTGGTNLVTSPVQFALVGTWPNGIVIDASTGIVSGTPTETGTFSSLSVSVTDSYGSTASLTPFSLVVAGAGVGPETWQSAGKMAMNINPPDDFNPTKYPKNLAEQPRAMGTDPYGYDNNLPLKTAALGYPEEEWGYPISDGTVDFGMTLQTQLNDTADAGVYHLSVKGNNPFINAGNGVISSASYNSGTNRYTAILTMGPGLSGGDIIAIRWNNITADFGALEVMQPGYSVGETGLTDAAQDHYGRIDGGVARGMDITDTNNQNSETNWVGSKIAGRKYGALYARSFERVFDFADAVGATPWVNYPAMLSNASMLSAMSYALAELTGGRLFSAIIKEYCNEPWNSAFPGYNIIMNQVMVDANLATGRTTGDFRTDRKILSVARVGTTVTVKLNFLHGRTVGQQIYDASDYDQATDTRHITPGIRTLTGTGSGGEAGMNLVFEHPTSGNWTGTVRTSWFDSYVYLDPSNDFCVPAGTGTPFTTFDDLYPAPPSVKKRWETERMYQMRQAAITAGVSSQIILRKGVQLDGDQPWYEERHGLAYALRKGWGLSWLFQNGGGFSPAYYLRPRDGVPAGFLDADDVFDELELVRGTNKTWLLKWNNTMACFGQIGMWSYEGWIHTHDTPNPTAKTAVRNAHLDARMATLFANFHQDYCNLAAGGGIVGYYGGAGRSFNDGNSTWPLIEGAMTDVDDIAQPKNAAITDLVDTPYEAVEINGINSGTIRIADVMQPIGGWGQPGNGMFAFGNDAGLPPNGFCAWRWFEVGDHSVGIKAGSTDTTDQVRLTVNGVQQGAAANLSSYSGDSTVPATALTRTVTITTRGWHLLGAVFDPHTGGTARQGYSAMASFVTPAAV